MAISPVSDIVLEVAKAADPAKSSAAAARLGAGASPYVGSFEEALGAARGPVSLAPRTSFEMSANDRRFLKSLRISSDEPTEKEVE